MCVDAIVAARHSSSQESIVDRVFRFLDIRVVKLLQKLIKGISIVIGDLYSRQDLAEIYRIPEHMSRYGISSRHSPPP
jgi:hypothetical protein